LVFRFPGILAIILLHSYVFAALPPLVCPAGGPIGSVDLRVSSPRLGAGAPLPLRTINRLEEGDTLIYKPLLRSSEKRPGEVTFVLVPANKAAAGENLRILDPKPARDSQEWKVPWKVAVVAYVYGPSGLNARKVRNFLARDDELVAQLADYAEKTVQTEALIAALASPTSSADAVQAALHGFSSQYGLNVQIDKTAPTNQQAMTLFRTLNPAIASYDPITPQASSQFAQTAGLATSVATLFFGSPVGLAAGGTAMVLELGQVAFPKAQFRSSFSQSIPNDGLGLCGRKDPAPPHTHIVYLWAARVPNSGPPQLSVEKSNSLPAALKSPIPVAASDPDWKFVDRARGWALQAEDGKVTPIGVQKLGDSKLLELDLGHIKPGKYNLVANWDWDRFQIKGHIDVEPLGDLASAHLVPSSQDLLVAKTGKVPATVEGADFEFVTKVEIEKINDKFASPASVPFVLPRGLRQGPQDKMDVQVNTIDLDPGDYKLLIAQLDGKERNVPVKILPAPPSIDNLPVVLNQGVSDVQFSLKGHRLDQLKRVEIARGKAMLEPASGGHERLLTLRMASNIAAGTGLALKAYVENRTEPLTFSDAVRIVGPRPTITEIRIAQPPDQEVQLGSEELAGDAYLSAILRVQHLQSNSFVKLNCQQQPEPAVTLRLGQSAGASRLQQLAPDQLFLSFDTSGWISGCILEATVANGQEGESDVSRLGRIVRVPRVERFEPAMEPAAASGDMKAVLVGKNLETIDKLGWSATDSRPVATLPLPLATDASKQELTVEIPPPPEGQASLLVWLRGEPEPRLTRVHLRAPIMGPPPLSGPASSGTR
jgi:hypothetical protein